MLFWGPQTACLLVGQGWHLEGETVSAKTCPLSIPWESAGHTAVPRSIHPVSKFEYPLSALLGRGLGTKHDRVTGISGI